MRAADNVPSFNKSVSIADDSELVVNMLVGEWTEASKIVKTFDSRAVMHCNQRTTCGTTIPMMKINAPSAVMLYLRRIALLQGLPLWMRLRLRLWLWL